MNLQNRELITWMNKNKTNARTRKGPKKTMANKKK